MRRRPSATGAPFVIPGDAVIHEVRCIADEATTTSLARGTRLRYLGENYDPTEGIGGDVFSILDGPFAGIPVSRHRRPLRRSVVGRCQDPRTGRQPATR